MFEKIESNNISELNEFLGTNNLPVINIEEFNSNPFLHLFVYRIDNNIIGYLNFSIIYENAELNQIFVEENFRNKGLGSIIMSFFLNACNKCNSITLEVRTDNLPAINLYKKYNFKKVAVRKNYYGDKDAYLMLYSGGKNNE